MRLYWSEVKVGLLVIVSVTALFLISVTVGNFKDYWNDTIQIKIKINSVAGLEKESQVTYAGVRIGKVVDTIYNTAFDMPVIVAEIERDAPVALDSVARITYSGMLTPIYVTLTGGSEEKRLSKLLCEGKISPDDIYIESKTYIPMGDAFSFDLEPVLGQVEALMEQLEGPLSKADSLIDSVSADVNKILKELESALIENRPQIDRLVNQLNGMIEEASSSVKPILTHLEQSTEQMPALLAKTGRQVDALLNNANGLIDSVSPQLTLTMQEMQTSLTVLREQIGRVENHLNTLLRDADSLLVENRQNITRIVERLEKTSANLDSLSGQLAKHPWRLIWKTEEIKTPFKVSPKWEPFETGASSDVNPEDNENPNVPQSEGPTRRGKGNRVR